MSRRQIRAGWRQRLREQQPKRIAPRQQTGAMAVARVSVHIAELHMQSFQRGEALRIADCLQQELSLILGGNGFSQSWLQNNSLDFVRLADIRLGPAGKSQVVAQRLAQALVQTKDWREQQ